MTQNVLHSPPLQAVRHHQERPAILLFVIVSLFAMTLSLNHGCKCITDGYASLILCFCLFCVVAFFARSASTRTLHVFLHFLLPHHHAHAQIINLGHILDNPPVPPSQERVRARDRAQAPKSLALERVRARAATASLAASLAAIISLVAFLR